MSEKRYVSLYIENEYADKIEKVHDNSKEIDDIISDYLLKTNSLIQNEIECLSSELLSLRANASKFRVEIKSLYTDLNLELEQLFETYDKTKTNLMKKINSIRTEIIKPISNDITMLKKEIRDIETVYQIEHFANAINKIQYLDSRTLEIIDILKIHYKKENEKVQQLESIK